MQLSAPKIGARGATGLSPTVGRVHGRVHRYPFEAWVRQKAAASSVQKAAGPRVRVQSRERSNFRRDLVGKVSGAICPPVASNVKLVEEEDSFVLTLRKESQGGSRTSIDIV